MEMGAAPRACPAYQGACYAAGDAPKLQAPREPTIEEKIEEWFTYHSPTPEQLPQYARVRAKAKELAEVIVANSPRCADQTAALRKLRECVMVVNQSIACRGI